MFAVFVALQFKRRARRGAASSPRRTDPGAVVESTGGKTDASTRSREDVSVEYDKQLTYADGTSKLVGVTIVTDERNGDRTFTVTGKEGRVGQERVDDGARRATSARRDRRHDGRDRARDLRATATASSGRRGRSSSRAAGCTGPASA